MDSYVVKVGVNLGAAYCQSRPAGGAACGSFTLPLILEVKPKECISRIDVLWGLSVIKKSSRSPVLTVRRYHYILRYIVCYRCCETNTLTSHNYTYMRSLKTTNNPNRINTTYHHSPGITFKQLTCVLGVFRTIASHMIRVPSFYIPLPQQLFFLMIQILLGTLKDK